MKPSIVAAVAIAVGGVAFGASVAVDATQPGAVQPKTSQDARTSRTTIYDAALYTQIPVRDITDANRGQYLADLRAAGVETLFLTVTDFHAIASRRKPLLDKLAADAAYFKRAGFPVMAWFNGFGYGNPRTADADGRTRFAHAQTLVSLDGRKNGALCPLDPALRSYLLETVRDMAKSGVDGLLMDDDYVQSARGRLGCACPRHLARLGKKLGREVTRDEVRASFAGKPNAVRTAFVDLTGEVAIELAKELRAEVDAVNPQLGMGICLSHTHWDIEGTDMDELLAAFAGPGGRKIVRLSGAPYWPDSRFHGIGLEGVLEFVRMQAEWTHGRGWTVFDENDPYPRKVAKVPAWRCELYDKATIADGLSARHKYMMAYGPTRAEPGYLEAHLANMSDDGRLRELFAGTEPYGVHVPFARRRIREMTLPPMSERETVELVSQPLAADLLVRCGIPVRHSPDAASLTLDESSLGVDLLTLDFANCRGDDYRPRILEAARAAGRPVGVYVRTSAPRVYQLVRRHPQTGRYSILLENFGDREAEVRVVTDGRPELHQSFRGAFEIRADGLSVRVPAQAWLAASFSVAAPAAETPNVAASFARADSWPEPSREARPWIYNWWMGSAVDEAGIRLQCDEMAKAGFGGFHVIPIYSVSRNPNDRSLFSKAWMDAWGRTVRLANEKGLGVDLTMGSGWCFGGPQLKPEDGSWVIEVDSKNLDGAKILWKGERDGKTVVLAVRPTGQQVKRSGPGGHGPMMNPFSVSAMTSFLRPFTAAFDRPGAVKPEHFYHDSYEYYGAGWSSELPAAFAKRRGYRLEDHYAELAGVGDRETVARIKCDYRRTLSEMIVEDVFPLWTGWCRARGIGTRNEAHGAPANWLDFYALADIPETEMFGCEKASARHPLVDSRFINSGDRDILVSKFASSAAHVKHIGAAKDPLVASESCTWIAEHFCETPGAVKAFLDRLFLSGVNHLFHHGMCYSPADAKWPGWTFYASCEMNRFNPLWQSADVLNAYVTRVQSVARDSAIDNDILVYWPLDDYWMDAEGFQKPMTVHARAWLTGQPVGRISRKLWDDGYAFDFVSEKQVMGLPADRGARALPYTTIVVPGAKAMGIETFARFVELAKGGWTVLFIDGFPVTVPGWKDAKSREMSLRTKVRRAIGSVQAGSYEELMSRAPVRREPFNKAAGLMFTRHAKADAVTYFIANQYRDGGVRGWFRPASPCRSALMRNPMTGETTAIGVKDGEIEIDLPIGASVLVTVYGTDRAAHGPCPPADSPVTADGKPILLDGEWTRTPICGGPERPAVVRGKLPLPWGVTSVFPECAFSGTMRYETTFEMDEDAIRGSRGHTFTLDLGTVSHAAKVHVNGTFAGAAIMAPYRVKIPKGLVKTGKNTLAVDVTGTGANRLKWLDAAKPYAWKIFMDINVIDVNGNQFDASSWEQQESGLSGPVQFDLNGVVRQGR